MLLLSRSRRILRAVAITVGVLGFSAVVALLPKPVAAAVTDAGVGVFPDHNGRVFVTAALAVAASRPQGFPAAASRHRGLPAAASRHRGLPAAASRHRGLPAAASRHR